MVPKASLFTDGMTPLPLNEVMEHWMIGVVIIAVIAAICKIGKNTFNAARPGFRN